MPSFGTACENHLDQLSARRGRICWIALRMVGFCFSAMRTAPFSVSVRHFGIALLGDELVRRFFEIRHDHLLLHGQFLAAFELIAFPAYWT